MPSTSCPATWFRGGTALGRSPERVGCGPLPLANLASLSPAFAEAGPLALVDLGAARTEVLIVGGGEPLSARTLSRGMADLPEGAPALAAELRQTFAAWLATGVEPIQRVWLLGFGALDPYGPAYLSQTLGVLALAVAPMALTVLTVIPYVNLGNLTSVWGILCAYVGLKTAHELSWDRAVWATLLPFLLVVAVLFLAMCLGTAIFAAVIGGVS